jgi:hypothetical protein
LPRVLLRWVALSEKKRPPPVFTAVGPDTCSDEAAGAADDRAPRERAKPGERAAWNKDQRRGARHFAKTQPAGVLVVACKCLQPLVQLLRGQETVSSESWFQKQLHACSLGLPVQTRAEEAHTQERLETCFRNLQELLASDGLWRCLPDGFRNVRYRGLAFSLLARAMGGIEHIMATCHRGYPLKLFRLIREPNLAKEIWDEAACTKDDFTVAFLKFWGSPEGLGSDAARAELFAIAAGLRMDISHIECRHGFIRRTIKARPSAPTVCMMDASAAFTLMR